MLCVYVVFVVVVCVCLFLSLKTKVHVCLFVWCVYLLCLRSFLAACVLSLLCHVMLFVLFGVLLFGVCVVLCDCVCIGGEWFPPRVRHDVLFLGLFVMLLCSSAWGGMMIVCSCVLYVFVCVLCLVFGLLYGLLFRGVRCTLVCGWV